MIYEKLREAFDFVGVIDVERYLEYRYDETIKDYKSIFVVGLAYPNIYLKHTKDSLTASMYTYGYDYHDVIKTMMKEALKDEVGFMPLADNHTVDERKCLEMTGLAFRGKNDLMIHKDFGSYFFIGLVVTKEHYHEVIVENNDSCGTCDICIKACPVNALFEGFNIDKCISAYNQSKRSLTDYEIEKNTLLMGCDICQRVCPRNKNIKTTYVDELQPKTTAYVLINDLFDLSNKEFLDKYGKHAYTWRGKTILLRNALTILLKQKNTDFNQKIKESIDDPKYPDWYKVDAENILKKLVNLNIK